jgi:hypothetical protein
MGTIETKPQVEQNHILPGGSKQDTTLAVPVPSLEKRVEQTRILQGGKRQDTTLAVPVSSLEKRVEQTHTLPSLEKKVEKK